MIEVPKAVVDKASMRSKLILPATAVGSLTNKEKTVSKIFKMEAQGDVMYVRAENETEARGELTQAIGEEIPDSLLTISEVNELPEGEEVLNPA